MCYYIKEHQGKLEHSQKNIKPFSELYVMAADCNSITQKAKADKSTKVKDTEQEEKTYLSGPPPLPLCQVSKPTLNHMNRKPGKLNQVVFLLASTYKSLSCTALSTDINKSTFLLKVRMPHA